MKRIEFAIVGAGWRAEFFLRIAKALPEQFRIVGMAVRNAEKAKTVAAQWGVATFPDIDGLFAGCKPAYVIVSTPQPVAPGVIAELVKRNVAVLTETPPAPTREGLLDLWKLVEKGARIQVAEQYTRQPLHAARLALVRAGILGEPNFTRVSDCHGYHGTSLIRNYLKAGFAPAVVNGRAFEAPIVAGPGRDGAPKAEKIVTSRQVLAQIDFEKKLGVFDFVGDQYFSWFRSRSVLVRGVRGEIRDLDVRYLESFDKPIRYGLHRENAGEEGNLEGLFHKGYTAGAEWLYGNPFPYAPLSDDEIAIADVLLGMQAYVDGGPDVYSFAEAAQDQVLSLAIEDAVKTNRPVSVEAQPWAK